MFIDNQNITILSELLFVHSSIIRTFVSNVIFQLETRDKWQLSPRVGFWWSVVYLAIYSEEPSDSYYWSSAQSAVTFKYSIFSPIAHIRASTAAARRQWSLYWSISGIDFLLVSYCVSSVSTLPSVQLLILHLVELGDSPREIPLRVAK